MLSIAERMNKKGESVLSCQLSFYVLPEIMEEKKMVAFELLLVYLHVLTVLAFDLSDLL